MYDVVEIFSTFIVTVIVMTRREKKIKPELSQTGSNSGQVLIKCNYIKAKAMGLGRPEAR